MKILKNLTSVGTSASIILIALLSGCADLNGPYGSPGGFGGGGGYAAQPAPYYAAPAPYPAPAPYYAAPAPYYGGSTVVYEEQKWHRDHDGRDDHHDHGDYHDNRPPPGGNGGHYNNNNNGQHYNAPPRQEYCPSGFSQSEQKCSNEDRKHGCKDMRLPGGLGCVHR